MYKWPQGKVIRTIGLMLAVVIAIDLGYNGAFAQLEPYYASGVGTWRQLAVGIFFAVLAAAALITGIVAIGFHKRAVDFLIEVEQEMTRVTWPTGRDLFRSTLFIAVMIAVLAGGIIAVDLVNRSLLKLIFGVES